MHSRFAAASLFVASLVACKKPDPAGDNAKPVGTEQAKPSSSSVASSSAPIVPSAIASIVTLPGVDTSGLVPREQQLFAQITQTALSPCGEAFTLATCVQEKRACATCVPAAITVANAVSHGVEEVEIRNWLKGRFDPSVVKTVPAGDSPSSGPETAPIVLTEFIDFECPHCAAATPIVKSVLGELTFASSVRWVMKMYPLTAHPHAKAAAIAAIAAGAQGKFFAMEELLFANQDKLEASDLEKYAVAAGLDVSRWRADLPKAAAKVDDDLKLGNDLKLVGVPTIFIDGREFVPLGDIDFAKQLEDWLTLEQQIGK